MIMNGDVHGYIGLLRISHGWVHTPKEKKPFIPPLLRLREHDRRRSGKDLRARKQEGL